MHELISSRCPLHIVFNLPVLGPVLGPIVYDLKCVLDGLLDLSQLQLDGLLNSLSPLLSGLTQNYSESVCRMAPSLEVC
jgi:hypothetical protein